MVKPAGLNPAEAARLSEFESWVLRHFYTLQGIRFLWGHSSIGRAADCLSAGWVFESPWPRHF